MSRSARARSTLAPKRFRTTAALFLALSTAGFMAQPAIGGTAPANCPGGGQVIEPSDNLVAAVSDTGTSPEVFCLRAGTHNIGASILYPDPGDRFIGATSTMVGRDVRAPSKIAGTGYFIFGSKTTSGPANITMEHLEISGATATPEQCNVYGGPSRCGTGVKWGPNFVGRYLDVHDNVNQGIGGGGAGGSLLKFVELHHNGSTAFCCGSYASSAGVKGTAHYTIQDSWVHHNDGSGVWCDVFCKGPPTMLVQRNVITDNTKHGVHYEISYGPIIVRNNTIQRNAQGLPYTSGGGVIITDSQNATVEWNTFGGSGFQGLKAHTTNRPPGLSNVIFRDNTMNGDVVKGCDLSTVDCSNNS